MNNKTLLSSKVKNRGIEPIPLNNTYRFNNYVMYSVSLILTYIDTSYFNIFKAKKPDFLAFCIFCQNKVYLVGNGNDK